MSSKYQKLFEPLTMDKLTIKNRISMSPLGIVAMADPPWRLRRKRSGDYIERAKGGTGLIITGVTNVNLTLLCL